LCGTAYAQGGPTYSSEPACRSAYSKGAAGYDATYMRGHKPLAKGESTHPYEVDACVLMDTVAGKKWVIQKAGQPKADYVKNSQGILRRFDCGNRIYELVLFKDGKSAAKTAEIEGPCSTCTIPPSEAVVTAVPSTDVQAIPQGELPVMIPQGGGVVVSNTSYWGGGYGGYYYVPSGGWGSFQSVPRPRTVPQPPPVTPPRPWTAPFVPPPSSGGGGGFIPPPLSQPVFGGGNPPIVNPPINWGGGTGGNPPSVTPPINWGGGGNNAVPPGVSPPINWGGGGGNTAPTPGAPRFWTR